MPSPRVQALLRRIDTLERNQQRLLNGLYREVSSVAKNDTNTIDCLIVGDILPSYSVVLVIESGMLGQISQVVPYTAGNVAYYESNAIGVALGVGEQGDTVKVQIAGHCLVRILPGTSEFAFNNRDTGAITAGAYLKVNDSGQVELSVGQTGAKFVALESQYYNVANPSDATTNDDVLLCSFIGGGGSSYSYDGPWKVIIDPLSVTAVCVNDPSVLLADGSRIIIGNASATYPTKFSVTIAASSFIYLEFSDVTGATLSDFKSSGTFPDSENGIMRWVLAYATWDGVDSKVDTVTQIHHGHIIIPARVGL